MNENHPAIADIQTSELIYYDADYCADCYRFCKERDIDCLPAVDNPDAFFLRNDDLQRFDEGEINEDRRLDAKTYVFMPDLLDRFREHPLQFVFEHGRLTGVVHFSDYNRDVVSTYLYAQLVMYERELRELLMGNGLTNDDMAEFFQDVATNPKKSQATRAIYEEKLERLAKQRKKPEFRRYPEFQAFDLADLVGLVNKRKVIKLDTQVGELRNRIMHARDSVNMVDPSTADYIYETETFVEFFTLAQLLLKDGRRVHTGLLIRSELHSGEHT